MKLKTLVASLVVLLGLTVFFSPAAQAQNTVCTNAVGLTPDGTAHTGSFTAVGQDRWFSFVAKVNRSYSLMVENNSSSDVNNFIDLTEASVDKDCVGTPADTQTLAFDEGTEPATQTSDRVNVVSASNQTVFFPLNSSAGSAGSFQVRVLETTLFNPAWSTFGTFETFYSCINATNNSALDATLRMFDTTGAEVASFTFDNVPAGGTVSRNTGATSLNVGNNLNGSATLAHNGPPGAFICEAAIADFATAPRVIQPVKFQRRNND